MPAGGSSLSVEIEVGMADANRDFGSIKRMLVFVLFYDSCSVNKRKRDALMVQIIMKLEM